MVKRTTVFWLVLVSFAVGGVVGSAARPKTVKRDATEPLDPHKILVVHPSSDGGRTPTRLSVNHAFPAGRVTDFSSSGESDWYIEVGEGDSGVRYLCSPAP